MPFRVTLLGVMTFAHWTDSYLVLQTFYHLIFFSCVLYYIKLHYITLSYYLVYASLLSLLQLFFCLHVRLLCAIKCYLLTYLFSSALLQLIAIDHRSWLRGTCMVWWRFCLLTSLSRPYMYSVLIVNQGSSSLSLYRYVQ